MSKKRRRLEKNTRMEVNPWERRIIETLRASTEEREHGNELWLGAALTMVWGTHDPAKRTVSAYARYYHLDTGSEEIDQIGLTVIRDDLDKAAKTFADFAEAPHDAPEAKQ